MPPAPMPPPTSGGQPSMSRIFPHLVHFAYRSPSSVWNARHRCQPREHLIRFTATQAYAAGSGDAFLWANGKARAVFKTAGARRVLSTTRPPDTGPYPGDRAGHRAVVE